MAHPLVIELWSELKKQTWNAPSPHEVLANHDANLMFVANPTNKNSMWVVGPYTAVRDLQWIFNTEDCTNAIQSQRRQLEENLAKFGFTLSLGRRSSDVWNPAFRQTLTTNSWQFGPPYRLVDERRPGQETKWNKYIQAHHIVEKRGCLSPLGVDRDELSESNEPAFMLLGEFHQEIFTKRGREARNAFENYGSLLRSAPQRVELGETLETIFERLEIARNMLVQRQMDNFSETIENELRPLLAQITFRECTLRTIFDKLQETADRMYVVEDGLASLRHIAYNINLRATKKIIEGFTRALAKG